LQTGARSGSRAAQAETESDLISLFEHDLLEKPFLCFVRTQLFGPDPASRDNMIVQLIGAQIRIEKMQRQARFGQFARARLLKRINARGEFPARSRHQWGAFACTNFCPKYARRITSLHRV